MSLSSQHHSFDISLAAAYGIEEAILIHHFQHWIRINQRAKRNLRDGKCWTYQSRKEIQLHFPYWDYHRIRRICERLVELGVLVTANYNKSQVDRTLWYAFVNEKAFQVDTEFSNNLYERQICQMEGQNCPTKGKSATPIPDTKSSYSKAQIKEKSIRPPSGSAVLPADAVELAHHLFSKIRERKKDFKEPDLNKWAKDIDKMIRLDQRQAERIRQIIDWASSDPFWSKNILSGDKLRERFDRLELDEISSKQVNDVKQNVKFALDEKRAYPQELKVMAIRGDYVLNTMSQKEISLTMKHEAFVNAFLHLFGGKNE